MISNWSIGTRLTIIVIAVVLLILPVITFVGTQAGNNAISLASETRFSTKSRNVVNAINTQLLRLNNNIELLALVVGGMGNQNDAVQLRETLANFVTTDTDDWAVRFNVLRPDGRVGVLTLDNPLIPRETSWRVYSNPTEIPTDPNFRVPFTTQEAHWFEQEETLYDPERQSAITIVAPYRINEVVRGVVWMDIPTESFQDQIARIVNDEGLVSDTSNGYALIVDLDSRIVTTHNLDIRNRLISNPLRDFLADIPTTRPGELVEVNEPINNRLAFTNLYTFGSTGWKFIATSPIAEIPSIPNEVYGPVIVVSILGVLLLAYVIQSFMNTSLVDPLKQLGTAAQEIGAGDFRFYISQRDKQNEIGRLAQAMEEMRIGLESSYDELSRWSRTLEKRVVDRTKELDAARTIAQESANELRAIYTESLVVVNETKLKPILDALIQRLPTLLQSTYVAVWLITEDRERLQLVATNEKRHREGRVILVGEGIVGQSVQQAKPIILESYETYEYNIPFEEGEEGEFPFSRALSVPLIYIGRAIGAIVVGRPKESKTYDADDQRLLTLFANLVSPSVRNAQLFVMMNNAIEDADRANQVKTRFLASVTHELRTPLNLVINNMDFMRVGAFGDINGEQKERLGQTVRSAEHLLYLINDLLDISKIEAGEMQLFIQDNDINTMLDDTIDNAVSFMEKIEGKMDAVELVMDLDDDLPKIPMDMRRIRQVLTNLLTNAIKFTDKGTVTLKVVKEEMGVEFSVTDTGMGIPEEEANKLFEAFERTRNAKESNIEGTGLGLPISKYLVEQHNGSLTFKSTFGVGTTFSFFLPYVQPTVSETKEMQRSDPSIAAMLTGKVE
jgi:signal transduction histidine kinase